jgi:hypothetical protein
MEPEGSLPCSQKPATVPNTEPDESSKQLPIIFLRLNPITSLYLTK